MSASLEIFAGLFALSAFIWVITYLYFNFSIKFIVKRYKYETKFADTLFFKDHVPFILDLPDFLAAGFFATHLSMCVWGWKFFSGKEIFRDISDPESIAGAFSGKEIRRIRKLMISAFVLLIHFLAYGFLRLRWPEAFS